MRVQIGASVGVWERPWRNEDTLVRLRIQGHMFGTSSLLPLCELFVGSLLRRSLPLGASATRHFMLLSNGAENRLMAVRRQKKSFASLWKAPETSTTINREAAGSR